MSFLFRDRAIATRTSQSKRAQQGFSLLELVIVLTLIALLSSIVASGFSRSGEGGNSQRVATEIAAGLQATRSLAMSNGVSATFQLDLKNKQFSSDGQSARSIDGGIEITMLTAEDEVLGDDKAAIRFFPNGGSTGGRIIIKEHEDIERRVAIAVDWVTGRVSISP